MKVGKTTREKNQCREKKLLGQREGRIEILTNSMRSEKPRKEKKRKNKERKKGSRALSYSNTCYKLTKQYITNCPELRRLQFSETDTFNVF